MILQELTLTVAVCCFNLFLRLSQHVARKVERNVVALSRQHQLAAGHSQKCPGARTPPVHMSKRSTRTAKHFTALASAYCQPQARAPALLKAD